ncbi:elongation factor P 5-aminopentanone reductase [Chakrabartyella piscis]|uniref:elongation factor P 5-aminopentanone reductase n=1 Tax=Chakrabartyella piscis TaxID=2918914 RepID=UPI002958C375|nr:SDR family oxidoreductase [Chakrabartyella piscis]
MQKTVLITGSSRGIGRGIAKAFGKAGYRIVLNASKSQEELLNTAKELEDLGISVLPILADVSDYVACQKMFQEIENAYGTVDVLVNNAGISHIGLFTDMRPENWQKMIAINFESVCNCCHLALPSMVRNKLGTIINISSIWGNSGASCEAVYSATKGAINAFTQALAKEYAPSGIRVNAIACGVIETQMNACFDAEERQNLADEIPMMRFGTTEEVGNVAVFLANDASSYLTGQILTLDGGFL